MAYIKAEKASGYSANHANASLGIK